MRPRQPPPRPRTSGSWTVAPLAGPVLLAFAGCHASAEASLHRVDASEQARTVVARACGECHTAGLSTAVPEALAVFDVSRPGWAATMTEAQLQGLSWRLAEPMVPTRDRVEARPLSVPVSERRLVETFVSEELRRRKAARPLSGAGGSG